MTLENSDKELTKLDGARDVTSPRTDFDFTILSTFSLCPRKYHYRFNLGRVLKTPQTAADFGGAIHKALDSWYTDTDTDKAVALFKETYAEQPDVDGKRTHAMGEWIIRNYALTYADQPWELVATEKAFEVPLDDTGETTFIGRIDKIIRWNNVLWVVDHKTTSSLGPTYVRMIEPNAQFTGYTVAARLLGYDVKGIILDALLVAKGLLDSSRRGRLTPTLRYDSYRTEEALAEWEVEFIELTSEIKAADATFCYSPKGMFNGGCTYYGECPYRQVCCEDSDLRARLLEADYNVDFWDPRD